jgi:hypothetical protein
LVSQRESGPKSTVVTRAAGRCTWSSPTPRGAIRNGPPEYLNLTYGVLDGDVNDWFLALAASKVEVAAVKPPPACPAAIFANSARFSSPAVRYVDCSPCSTDPLPSPVGPCVASSVILLLLGCRCSASSQRGRARSASTRFTRTHLPNSHALSAEYYVNPHVRDVTNAQPHGIRPRPGSPKAPGRP